MIRSHLTLLDWAKMDDETARRECEALARALPHGLRLTSLAPHTYCGRTHRVARFSRREAGDPAHFVLVPGGEAKLGFDGRNFKPTPEQLESFRDWPAELLKQGMDVRYVKLSIEDWVDAHTSPPRTATVPAILVEVEAQEIIEPVSPDDPILAELSRESPAFSKVEFPRGFLGESGYIRERGSAGNVRGWRQPPTTVDDVKAGLAKTGMRLLTCDEWEHACGAGASTLFRWGDSTPADFYPGETCAEDRELRVAWAMSAGKLKYETPPPGWNLHDTLNLFGLRIAHYPYEMDIVADEPWILGGDGGCNICGGVGFFLGWLPLATAYRNADGEISIRPDKDSVADHYYRVRRVIPLD